MPPKGGTHGRGKLRLHQGLLRHRVLLRNQRLYLRVNEAGG
jgi:hypothetical protein